SLHANASLSPVPSGAEVSYLSLDEGDIERSGARLSGTNPQTVPVLDEYSGCKSWVELGQDVPLGHTASALSDSEYEDRADEIRGALGAETATV
ncbi:MAG: DUF1802 family protein, partial [SAR202 cluster bacterium]|nr:DUF1802 family protein [SAR202 cluster bacterium]